MTLHAHTAADPAPPGDTHRWHRTARIADQRSWLIFAVGAVIAAITYFTNLRHWPDFDLDEVMYALAGRNVAGHGSLSWNGLPIMVHPPLHFLLLGGWLRLTGNADTDPVHALMTVRYLTAAISVINVLLIGVLARTLAKDRPAHVRAVVTAAAILLAVSNGFLIRFGRTGLIEPTALLLGLLVIIAALRLRAASTPVYIAVVGILSGLACLVKEPALFIVLTPLLAAALHRDRVEFARAMAAAGTGLLLWLTFPLWALLNGHGDLFSAQHGNNLGRLLGILQVSGLNRNGVAASDSLLATMWQFLGAYLMFILGAVGLVLALRRARPHRRAAAPTDATLIAFGVLTYGFVLYSLAFGQANEQLTVYAAPSAVLLSLLPWTTPAENGRSWRREASRSTQMVAWATCILAATFGIAAWAAGPASKPDDATIAVSRFIRADVPHCAAINATGNALRWSVVLHANPVTSHRSGPEATADRVHVFLLSPKDSRFSYGNSSPQLDEWVHTNGRMVYSTPSQRYEQIQVWYVGVPTQGVRGGCVNAVPSPSIHAPAGQYLLLLGSTITVVIVAAGVAVGRRRTGQRW